MVEDAAVVAAMETAAAAENTLAVVENITEDVAEVTTTNAGANIRIKSLEGW